MAIELMSLRERLVRPGEPGTVIWLGERLTREEKRELFRTQPINFAHDDNPEHLSVTGVFVADRHLLKLFGDEVVLEQIDDIPQAAAEKITEALEMIRSN